MKKSVITLFAIVIFALAIIAVSFASGPFFPSGDKTATGLIYTGKCTMGHVVMSNDGTNDCSLVCYDNTSAAGTTLFPTVYCQAANGKTCALVIERSTTTGIYCTLTTAGTCTYGIGYHAGW